MPIKHLTHQTIKSIKNPPSGTVDYYDSVCKGLGFRASYDGGRSWRVKYRAPNDFDARGERKQRVITIGKYPGMGLAEATDEYDEIIKQVRHNKDPQKEKMEAKRDSAIKLGPDPLTVAEGIARYVEDHVRRKNKPHKRADGTTHFERERVFEKYVTPYIGGMRLDEIKRKDVMTMRRRIDKAHGATQADRAVEALRSAFNWLHDKELGEDVLIFRFKAEAEKRVRDRVLEHPEIEALWNDLDKEHQAGKKKIFASIVKILLLTGQRREEVAGMRWSELDLDGLKWNLPPERTKNKLPHTVPLSDAVLEIIQNQERIEGSDLVFSFNGVTSFTGYSRSKQRMDKRLKFSKPWWVHDLRRTFVTQLNELGIPPQVIEACVNHISGASKGGIAGIYNRAEYWPQRVAAMNLWADTLAAIVAGTVDANVIPFKGEVD